MFKGLVSGIVTGVLVAAAVGFVLSMATPLQQKPTDMAQNAVPQVPDTPASPPVSKPAPAGPQIAPGKISGTETSSGSRDVAGESQPAPAAPNVAPSAAVEPTKKASASTPPTGPQRSVAQPSTPGPATSPQEGQLSDNLLPRSGLSVPVPDQAPGAQISTTPIARPETGAPASAAQRPLPDSAPPAPSAADRIAQLPPAAAPSGPSVPATERAVADPGLPGRAVQSTAIVRTSPPAAGGAILAVPGQTTGQAPLAPAQADLQESAVPPVLPQIGGAADPVPARDDRMAMQRSAAVPTNPAGNESPISNPEAKTAKTGLPVVRRPGAEGGTLPGDPARRGGFGGIPEVASNGPSVPPPPLIEDRALPIPGFDGLRSGVRTKRLPQIGGATAEGEKPLQTAPDKGAESDQAVEVAGVPEAAVPIPLVRNAEAFENPEGRPVFAVILRDIGAAGIGRERLAALDLPVTIAVDPASPDAEAAALAYRAAGKEVVILAAGLPADATAQEVEVNLAAMFNAVPQAVALLDPVSGGFQNDRMRAQQIVRILADEGYGLVTYHRGLNAAAQLAQRDGVPDGRVFRVLDEEQEDEPLIRRYLDRAAFRAAQQGQAIVLGDSRATTVAALLGWAMEGRGATVAFAPVSAVLGQP